MIVETWLGVIRHLGAGLGAKVLNDDFLQVPILFVQGPQLEQSGEALTARFADADENAGGKRNRRFAGGANDFETPGGIVYRASEMEAPTARKPARPTLQHQALRHGNA